MKLSYDKCSYCIGTTPCHVVIVVHAFSGIRLSFIAVIDYDYS